MRVSSDMTSFRNKPLQQYFKPLITDHLSPLSTMKSSVNQVLSKTQYCERGKKGIFSKHSPNYIKKAK